MNVLHTIASTAESHGGTSRTVTQLCSALAESGARVRLVTTHSPDERMILPGSQVQSVVAATEKGVRQWLTPSHGFTAAMMATMQQEAPEIIHDHGAWLSTNRASAGVARESGIPYIVSTRGMFSPWALRNGLMKKRLAWRAYQRRVLRRAVMLHATSDGEAADLRRLGMKQPIAIIPNGVHIPPGVRGHVPSRRALFLSRMHPVKNVEILLRAWALVRPPGWELHLVGPDDIGYGATLRRIIAELGLGEQVLLAGAVDDREKWSTYAAAELFVLPSHSENFGMSVAEALASGLPVITTTGMPWSVVAEEGCGWWVSPSIEGITNALSAATALTPEERTRMGCLGRELVRARFSWQRVSTQMLKAYDYVTSGGTRPVCVHLN